MEAILDAAQDAVAAEPDAGEQPATAQPDDAVVETQLAQEISTLWSDNLRLSADRKASAKELRQVRARLAERLHEMKSLLSRPGRGGQWRSWLKERKIPRSTADRLAARYAEALGSASDGNVPSGAIPGSPEDSPEKLAKSVWRRVGKFLSTGELVLRFIGCIAEISGVGHEQRDEGLMILHAAPKAADEVPAPGPATEPAPQPHGETPAPVEVPAAEAAPAQTEAVQAPAAADATSGAVV